MILCTYGAIDNRFDLVKKMVKQNIKIKPYFSSFSPFFAALSKSMFLIIQIFMEMKIK